MIVLILLSLSFAVALGGGLFEGIVLASLWGRSPPASFAIIHPGTGVPLQRFWIPVHAAITLFLIWALVATWGEEPVRRILLFGAASYVVMRAWSGVYFIREMLAFQKVPLDAPATPALSARVQRWMFWSWFREPLDVISLVCSLLALYQIGRV
jgi:hypothetical protein